MSHIIVFCGESGTGKTMLAQLVSQELNIFCLHKDALKERLYELEGGKTLEDSTRTGKQSIFLMLDLAEDAIRNGVDIILEAPFDHSENVIRFEQWMERYQVSLKCIVCTVSEVVRQARIHDRPRHHAHHDQERLTPNYFQLKYFSYHDMPGEQLVLNTDKPVAELMREVRSFVG